MPKKTKTNRPQALELDPVFERYYRTNLGDDTFEQFWEASKEPLPCVVRLRGYPQEQHHAPAPAAGCESATVQDHQGKVQEEVQQVQAPNVGVETSRLQTRNAVLRSVLLKRGWERVKCTISSKHSSDKDGGLDSSSMVEAYALSSAAYASCAPSSLEEGEQDKTGTGNVEQENASNS
ncbi:unnamed protein product, partial [Amoebophrya sp. A25]|eukprot:GSA25T00000136001.1